MDILRAENIVKNFSGHQALDNVSLSIPEGCIYGILGPNGAGKTTFIRIVNRILAPDSGELFFSDQPMKAEDISAIGYLPEERGLYRKMKVGEQAVYLARLKGLTKKDATIRLKQWFEKYEIAGWWNRRVEELSKGMQQKVQFIVTILHEPKLIIFDEPFSGFDPINVNILKQDILDLKSKGSTIIFSTHNMSSVEELCDHITLINNSRNVLSGRVHDIRRQYRENIFHIQFEGDANSIYVALQDICQVESLETQQGVHSMRIRISRPIKENDLLTLFINKVNVISFQEIMPGMVDIFIKAVRNSISM